MQNQSTTSWNRLFFFFILLQMFPYSPHCPLLSHSQSPILDWNEVFKPGRNPAKRKGYVLSMRLCSQKSSLTPRSLGQPIQSPLGTEQFPLCPRLGPRCPLLSWFIGDWSSHSHGIPLQRTNQIKAATSGNQISRKLTTEKKKKNCLFASQSLKLQNSACYSLEVLWQNAFLVIQMTLSTRKYPSSFQMPLRSFC